MHYHLGHAGLIEVNWKGGRKPSSTPLEQWEWLFQTAVWCYFTSVERYWGSASLAKAHRGLQQVQTRANKRCLCMHNNPRSSAEGARVVSPLWQLWRPFLHFVWKRQVPQPSSQGSTEQPAAEARTHAMQMSPLHSGWWECPLLNSPAWHQLAETSNLVLLSELLM